MIFNICEALKNRDKQNDCKYDFLTTYQCNKYSNNTKRELIENLNNNCSDKKLEFILSRTANTEKIDLSEKFLEQFDSLDEKDSEPLNIHYYALVNTVKENGISKPTILNVCTASSIDKALMFLDPVDSEYVIEISEQKYDDYFKGQDILDEGAIWDAVKNGVKGVADAVKNINAERKNTDSYRIKQEIKDKKKDLRVAKEMEKAAKDSAKYGYRDSDSSNQSNNSASSNSTSNDINNNSNSTSFKAGYNPTFNRSRTSSNPSREEVLSPELIQQLIDSGDEATLQNIKIQAEKARQEAKKNNDKLEAEEKARKKQEEEKARKAAEADRAAAEAQSSNTNQNEEFTKMGGNLTESESLEKCVDDRHTCQGRGKPLSQCTCEVDVAKVGQKNKSVKVDEYWSTETSDKSINESNNAAYDAYKKQYKYLLQDIKYVLNSDNIEDIRAYDKESQGEYILSKLFDSRMNKQNMSFEDAKEDVIDFLYRARSDAKSELELRNKRSLESKSIMNKVKSELSKDYKLVSESENTLYFKAPDNSTHDDCIAFVDKVVAVSGGKYKFTGRGGSWTQWDILTPGGSYIKAGYDYSNKDNYAVYFKSILIESRSTKSTSKVSVKDTLEVVDKSLKESDNSLNHEMAVKMSRDDFDRMCRENRILQGLSSSDYREIRDFFYLGYEDFDAAVNDLWNGDNNYHSRDWYDSLLKKYTNSVKESVNHADLTDCPAEGEFSWNNFSLKQGDLVDNDYDYDREEGTSEYEIIDTISNSVIGYAKVFYDNEDHANVYKLKFNTPDIPDKIRRMDFAGNYPLEYSDDLSSYCKWLDSELHKRLNESLKESLNLNEAKNIINVLNKNLRVRFKHSAGGIFSLDRTPFNEDTFNKLIKNNYKIIGDILEEQGLKYDISEDAYISKDINLYVTIYGDIGTVIVQFDEMESESLKESVNSDIVSTIKKQFPEATVKTSVRKHSDVHKSNPDTPVGKTKYVDIRITPDSASSVNSILQYCNHNIKKVLDSNSRFYYYGDVPARNPRGSKEVVLSYQDYSGLSDDEYKSLLGESVSPFATQIKSHHICQGCGKPLSQCTCKVEDLEKSYKLGDEVTWRGSRYIIIDDENEDLVVLRPVDRFQDSDFDDIDSGDSSEDVFLAKFQLNESLKEFLNNDIVELEDGVYQHESMQLPRIGDKKKALSSNINQNEEFTKMIDIFKVLNEADDCINKDTCLDEQDALTYKNDQDLEEKVERRLRQIFKDFDIDSSEAMQFSKWQEVVDWISSVIKQLKDTQLTEDLSQEEIHTSGISAYITDAINGEYDTINDYNEMLLALKDDSQDSAISVIEDIVKEEYTHIGQLQELLKMYASPSSEIKSGEVEAQKQIEETKDDQSDSKFDNEFGLNSGFDSFI